MRVVTWASSAMAERGLGRRHVFAALGAVALAVLYVAATSRLFAGGWLYLDDYVKCEMVENDGFWASFTHYWSVYSSAYRPFTPGPVAWLGASCGTPQLVTIPAAVMHLGSGVALGIGVARFSRVWMAGILTATAWWFMPFQGEILGWPTNSSAYAPVALLTACALAVLLYPGDLGRVTHRRWLVFAILAIVAFAIAEQVAVAVIVLVGVLAMVSHDRRVALVRAALYAAGPFLVYLALVAATSGDSSYSRTDTSPDAALDSIWSNIESRGLFTGLDTLPGGHYWTNFADAAWRGQWLSAVIIFAVVLIAVVAIARGWVTDDEPRVTNAVALAAGSLVGIVLGFLLNSLEAPLWVSPRMFYLPGLFTALFLGGCAAILIGVSPKRAQLISRAACIVFVAGLATVGAVVLRGEGALYQENARLESRWAQAIAQELPAGDDTDVAIIGMPWTVVGADGQLVPLGEHIVSSIRVQWAFPAALAWYTGDRIGSVTYWETPESCGPVPPGSLVMIYEGTDLRRTTDPQICAGPDPT